MIFKRLITLWKLSKYTPEEAEIKLNDSVKMFASLPVEIKEGKVVIIPYKRRDPAKEIVDQLPENQKEI